MNQLINVEGKYIVVSDEAIKVNDFVYSEITKSVFQVRATYNENCKKIIASQTPLPNIPTLLSTNSEIYFLWKQRDIDLIKLADKYSDELIEAKAIGDFQKTWIESIFLHSIEIYKGATSEKSFSLDEVIGFAKYYKNIPYKEYEFHSTKEFFQLYLNSLTIPPCEVEIETTHEGVKIKSIL